MAFLPQQVMAKKFLPTCKGDQPSSPLNPLVAGSQSKIVTTVKERSDKTLMPRADVLILGIVRPVTERTNCYLMPVASSLHQSVDLFLNACSLPLAATVFITSNTQASCHLCEPTLDFFIFICEVKNALTTNSIKSTKQ